MHVDKLSPDIRRELQLNSQMMVAEHAGKVHKLDGDKN